MISDFKLMPTLEDLSRAWQSHAERVVLVLLVLIVLVIVYQVLTWAIKKRLARHATSERQMANVRVFLRLWRYAIIFLGALIVIFTYTQSLTALGLSAGFLGAALGFALQTPIAGVAAWLMIIIKKPFQPGDRVTIGSVQGDVYDITLTHVILEEFGGTTIGEERSGRFIMIPTSSIFSANIINSTLKDDFVLKEVPVSITYESNIDHAVRILEQSAFRHAKGASREKGIRPYVRTEFRESCIELRVKYVVHVRDATQVSSAITADIHREVEQAKDVEIAYPHIQILTQGIPPGPLHRARQRR